MVELVDTSALGADAERRAGSSPVILIESSFGGIGRRATLRWWWEKSRGGSSPLMSIYKGEDMKQIIVNVSDEEYEAIKEMLGEKEMTWDQLFRQSLRVYSLVSFHQNLGQQMAWLDKDGNLTNSPIPGKISLE